jgi:hypothetical protein
MIVRRASVLVVAALAALTALAAPAAAGESKSDKALLKAGVITKADVPPDWTSKKSSQSDQPLRSQECKDIKTAVDNAKKKTPRQRSRDFEPSGTSATSAQDTVYVFKNVSGATKFIANYSDPSANACFQALANELATSQPTAGTLVLHPSPISKGSATTQSDTRSPCPSRRAERAPLCTSTSSWSVRDGQYSGSGSQTGMSESPKGRRSSNP